MVSGHRPGKVALETVLEWAFSGFGPKASLHEYAKLAIVRARSVRPGRDPKAGGLAGQGAFVVCKRIHRPSTASSRSARLCPYLPNRYGL